MTPSKFNQSPLAKAGGEFFFAGKSGKPGVENSAVPTKFTSETAKIAAQKSAESRRQTPLRAVPTGYKVVPAAMVDVELNVPTGPSYAEQRLARVRNQLDLVDCRIREEAAKQTPDGQLLNWLAAAQARLNDQERELSGRPLPGTLKPTAKPAKVSYDLQPQYSVMHDTPLVVSDEKISAPSAPENTTI